jgi:type II secretory pathway pseudopilin PulG
MSQLESVMKTVKGTRGFTLLEVTISAMILSGVFYMAISGFVSGMRGSGAGQAQLDAMANNARAMIAMNLELQEASVRDETVEIWPIDPQTGVIADEPVDSTAVPPPDTIYPTANVVGEDSFALRFMTVAGIENVGADTMTIQQAGPFLYRLGTGAPTDFPADQLVRVDQTGAERPRVLCNGVDQVVFQRDSRGGSILVTLITRQLNAVTGEELVNRQIITVTPKNDFSANLANFDMNGEEF